MSFTSLIIVLFISSFAFITIEAFCFSLAPYHLAAKALAQGTGNINSSSPCVYGNSSVQNSSCSAACKGLILATWGDCYCKDRDYLPDVSDLLVRTLNVEQIFELLATDKYSKFANCRDWLNEPDNYRDWNCL
eukprot:TRINITY_DN462_c0_g2_i1.p1 TRINITY_DN462_c0_g2~~TRINITY_DN462_c0_g2_i1.p1  ORF type:complete len:142 (+),score=13.19 TRINITY_DN462_c0_g2_i1:28-426(+)